MCIRDRRDKSKVLVAFGACATMGGIPGLANVASAQEIKDLVYRDNPSVDNPDGVYPQERYAVPEGELVLQHMDDTVKTLAQTVDVDYFMPGCPPEAHQIAAVLLSLIHISEPTRLLSISYAVFCLKKKN